MQDFHSGTIAIVGRPNVGKSTLLNQLVGEKISITSRKAQTTRHRINAILTTDDAQYVFVDTPGFQKKHVNALNRVLNRSVSQALADVDVVLLVIEAMKFGAADAALLPLLPKDKPVILAVNKIDQVRDKSLLLPFLAEVAARRDFSAVVPVSAEKGRQLDDLLGELRKHLPEGGPIFDPEDLTDRSERFIAAEFIREKLFRLLGDEVPYSTTVDIERFEVEGTLRRIHAAIIVDRPAQKAIVVGSGGEKIKQIASDARRDMERLFDGKVYLELWVKVKSGWADDERAVKAYGYES